MHFAIYLFIYIYICIYIPCFLEMPICINNTFDEHRSIGIHLRNYNSYGVPLPANPSAVSQEMVLVTSLAVSRHELINTKYDIYTLELPFTKVTCCVCNVNVINWSSHGSN